MKTLESIVLVFDLDIVLILVCPGGLNTRLGLILDPLTLNNSDMIKNSIRSNSIHFQI